MEVSKALSLLNSSFSLGEVTCLGISSQNRFILSGSKDKSIKFINYPQNTRVLFQSDNHHLDSITAIAASPDGRFIVSSSADKTIKVIDLKSQPEVHQFQDAHDSKSFCFDGIFTTSS